MAKDDKDPGTIDAFCDNALDRAIGRSKSDDFEKARARREYLRQKKRESRERLRKLSRSASTRRNGQWANMTDQVSLTITVGARAILEQLAKDAETSMSGIVEELIQKHKKARAMRAKMPGLFPGG